MNSNSENSRQYGAEDIRRYVQGEMSSAEMHGIEKAALDDPFLADAIEGYSESITGTGLPAVETGRDKLQKEFEERIKDSKRQAAPVIRMKWWQAAAAAAVIISAGILSYNSWKDGEPGAAVVSANETSQLPVPGSVSDLQVKDSVNGSLDTDSALNENPAGVLSVPEKNTKPALSEAPLALNQAERAKARMEEKQSAAPVSETDATNVPNKARRAPTPAPAQAAAAKPVADDRAEEREIAETTDQASATGNRTMNVRQKTEADAKNKSDAKNKKDQPVQDVMKNNVASVEITKTQSKKEASADAVINNSEGSDKMIYYQGQVLSNDNKPISNAILKLTDQKKAYSTDNNGNFLIPSVDSMISFDVTMVGKNPTRFTLNSTSGYNQLILPDAANEMSEVVVVGYGTKKKRSVTGSASVITTAVFNAAPVTGWPALQEYFEKNKNKNLIKFPGAPTDVHFRVDKNGTLSGFKVTRSISVEHDKEAIRLIKEGPAWKLIRGRKADITVTIIF